MRSSRDILIFLSLINNGSWDGIMKSLKEKEYVNSEYIEEVLARNTYKCITILDENYPTCLKAVTNPPFVLYYYGDISLLDDYYNNVSVIGSRECSEYGAEMTRRIVEGLAGKKNIVSGLAIGIDSIAHETAINNGGKTIAVLASGIDFCYPVRNGKLYRKIKKDHLVISEYPGELEPVNSNFPFRNRIVAALSKGVLVTEAKNYSGTLITVAYATQLGREIMCVPYHADEDSHCNRMIKEGAILVESAADVLYALDD